MTFVSSYVRRPASCVYLVLQIGGEWWVERETKACGPYQTKEDAEAGAFHILDLFGDPDRRAEIWSPNEEGKMRMIWKGKVEA